MAIREAELYPRPKEASEESLLGLIKDKDLDMLANDKALDRGVADPLISIAPTTPQAVATAPSLIVIL